MLPINSNQGQTGSSNEAGEIVKQKCDKRQSRQCNSVSSINGMWFFVGVYGPNSLQLVSKVGVQLESDGLYVIAELLLFLFNCCPTIFQGRPSAPLCFSIILKRAATRSVKCNTSEELDSSHGISTFPKAKGLCQSLRSLQETEHRTFELRP